MTKTYTLSNGDIVKVSATKNGIDYNGWGRNLTLQKYKVKIECNDKHFYTTFRDSADAYRRNAKVNIDEVLYCILSDAMCADNCRSYRDFCDGYGYDNYNEGMKVYNACQRISDELNYLLDGGMFEELYSMVEDC